MNTGNINRLAILVRQERDALLSQWRQEVKRLPGALDLDSPTLLDHIPDLLDELALALEVRDSESIVDAHLEHNPKAHGLQRLRAGFDITEVVAEYNVLRGCLHDLAVRHGLTLQGEAFHIVNRVLDEAIGLAVETYAAQKAAELQQRRDEHLAFVAHDLRTPLAAISMAAKTLEKQLPNEAKGEGATMMLKTLQRNVKRLDELVVKVINEEQSVSAELNAESPLKLERREFDLWPLVHRLISDLRPLADAAGARIINEVPEDCVVFADASLLTQVFQNLIANAINYTPHGEITIGAKEVGANGTGGKVECWVHDTGEGIPEERLGKVFDKLETDPEKEGGMGLGLAIVKQFVEAHSGQVTVESEPGKGSTFRFTLPASEIETT
jgi:signal transduction histidine kinase